MLESGPVADRPPSLIDEASEPAAPEIGGPQLGTGAPTAWAEAQPPPQNQLLDGTLPPKTSLLAGHPVGEVHVNPGTSTPRSIEGPTREARNLPKGVEAPNLPKPSWLGATRPSIVSSSFEEEGERAGGREILRWGGRNTDGETGHGEDVAQDSQDPGNDKQDPGVAVGLWTKQDARKWGDINKEVNAKRIGRVRSGSMVEDLRPYEANVARMQETIRDNLLYRRYRLNRSNLAQRLKFEYTIVVGTLRLVVLILVFWLFYISLVGSADIGAQRGIYQTMDRVFHFGKLEGVRNRVQFVSESLPAISEGSKDFFLLSSRYFQPSDEMRRGSASVQFVGDVMKFSKDKTGPDFTLRVPEYSFTGWVKLKSFFRKGFVLKKSAAQIGPGKDLVCWGIFIHKDNGPSLQYGAHDQYETGAISDELQVEVGLAENFEPTLEENFMLTVVVTPHNVTFYRNVELWGIAILPRPITDCPNRGEGLRIGAAGLELGALRFYPQVLVPTSIEELYVSGGLLADLFKGMKPPQAKESEVERLERVMLQSFDSVEYVVGVAVSDVTAVLSAVENEDRSTGFARPYRSPTAPLGNTTVNTTGVSDTDTGREYVRLLQGPYRLTSTLTERDESKHRYLDNMPDFHGTGMTLSYWYRHRACAGLFCGLYLFEGRTSSEASGNSCFGLWIENNSWYWDNPGRNGSPEFPRSFVEAKFELRDELQWRHIAWVFDETTDKVHMYLDGILAYSVLFGSAITGMDCSGAAGTEKVMTLGRRAPAFRNGGVVELYDLRMYVHTPGNPLTARDVLAIAKGATPGISENYKCLPIESESMVDTTWKDTWGHSCQWYYQNSQANPQICKYGPAIENCPMACDARQECFGSKQPPSYFLWDSIRRVDRLAKNGTVCLGDHVTKQQVVEGCRSWVADAGEMENAKLQPEVQQWLETLTEMREQGSNRIDLTWCDQLELSIDEYCSFDMDVVRKFTKDPVENNAGDFTIAFWMQPTGSRSLHYPEKRFYPSMSFYSSLSPPQHNLVIGKTLSLNGAARLFSAPNGSHAGAHKSVKLWPASDTDWTFVSISRKSQLMRVVTNSARNEGEEDLSFSLFNNSAMFSFLEIPYAALISPIMLVPKELEFAAVQELYYIQEARMRFREGPSVSRQEAAQQDKVLLNKDDFVERSALLAAPIIFQTRVNPATSCPFKGSTAFIENEHAIAVTQVCAPPFQCEEDFKLAEQHTFACPGDASKTRWGEFGLAPVEVSGDVGYSDILYSITDIPFLFRNGAVTSTSTFTDSMTEKVKVMLIFFSPRSGITSLLVITAEFMGNIEARVTTKLDHFSILEGDDLNYCLGVLSACIVLISCMFIDCLQQIYDALRRHPDPDYPDREWKRVRPPLSFIFRASLDLLVTALTWYYCAIMIPQLNHSPEESKEIVSGIRGIDWASTDRSLHVKQDEFFSYVTKVLKTDEEASAMRQLANWILIISMLRIVQATGVHPRLGILTGSVAVSVDDFMHFFALFMAVLCSFAGIGFWRFGPVRDDFGTFGETLFTCLSMMMGSLPDGWDRSAELTLFVLIYLVIVFFLVQNFLLAIIVEAYMTVRQTYEKLEIEQEFPTDVVNSYHAYVRAFIHGWPMPHVLGEHIAEWDARFSVGYRDLVRSGLFKCSPRNIGLFMKFYARFSFLKPVRIKGQMKAKEGMEMVDEMERRLALLVDRKPQTLRESAARAIQEKQERVVAKMMKKMFSPLARKGSDKPENQEPRLLSRVGSDKPEGHESRNLSPHRSLNGRKMIALEQGKDTPLEVVTPKQVSSLGASHPPSQTLSPSKSPSRLPSSSESLSRLPSSLEAPSRLLSASNRPRPTLTPLPPPEAAQTRAPSEPGPSLTIRIDPAP